MVNIGSPRAEVGEIDTRPPFQSVKAAVNLFVEVSCPTKLSQRPSFKKKLSENVMDKETQFLLAQRELNKIKSQLEAAETVRSRAILELERAKRTLQDLTAKLNAVNESKRSAIMAAEAVKELGKKLEAEKLEKAVGTEAWKRELEGTRKEYKAIFTELDASKKELNKIRQDFDTALEAKMAAFQLSGEANRSANANSDKARELNGQISAVKASISEHNAASQTAKEEKERLTAEREAGLEAHRAAKEAVAEKLECLEKEKVDPEVVRALEEDLKKASLEVEAVREEMRRTHGSEMDGARALTDELNDASNRLQEVGEEDRSLRSLVSSLRAELESILAEHRERKELEASNEERFVLRKLLEAADGARRERAEMAKTVEKVKKEIKESRAASEEAERKLKEIAVEAEEAKDRVRRVVEEIKILTQSGKVRLSVAEFNSLTRKVEEAKTAAESKEAESAASVLVINVRQIKAEKKLEANLKAIEEIKTATDLALRKAEMSESAKTVVESELWRWRHEEQRSGQLKN